MRQKFYIDTSVFGGYFDEEFSEHTIPLFDRYRNNEFTLLFSSVTQDELENAPERVKDFNSEVYRPIIRVFLDSVDKIFTDLSSEKAIISGTKNILMQPEFEDAQNFQSVIELVENRDIIIHILDKNKSILLNDLTITIGEENRDEKLSDYSMITKEYKIGDMTGTLGIMGPKRMDYSKIVAAIVYIAQQLTQELTKHR